VTEVSLADLQRLGAEVGFDLIGATSADPFPELIPRLREYAARGRTGFEHSDIEDRVNPRRWMPDAKSLISVAMPYLTREGKQVAKRHPAGGRHGVVTVYSYGHDYHNVMNNKLRALAHRLEVHVGRSISWKVAVDTSPLVDRRVAERAGLGWVAKNCMFYTEKYGSFVFLGTLVVDVDVETSRDTSNAAPGSEHATACGTCDLCLKACPTGALLAPGVIDAQRCLSYITQMKGMIPLAYRKAMGRRVWGCDTCQWSCPMNKDVEHSAHEEYLPQGELEHPDLLEILSLSNRQFLRKYGHTAAAWRGLRTWQRNALIALGNTKRRDVVPHILPFLQHPRAELRASAAWALKEIGGMEARAAVREAYVKEQEDWVRQEMEWAVQKGADA
jgi:epoxyqueuosine reductase